MYIAVKKSFFFSNVNVTATSRVATSTSNSQKVPRSIISAVAQTLLALAAPNICFDKPCVQAFCNSNNYYSLLFDLLASYTDSPLFLITYHEG